jgi:hypothetical protein
MKVEYSNRAVADLRKISADIRRAFGDLVRRMGRALAKPIAYLGRPVMGFALLYPSYTLPASAPYNVIEI